MLPVRAVLVLPDVAQHKVNNEVVVTLSPGKPEARMVFIVKNSSSLFGVFYVVVLVAFDL